MNAHPYHRATARNATLNRLLWIGEVLITVLVLATLVAVAAALAFFVFSAEGVDPVADLMLGLLVAGVLVGVLVAQLKWFIRGIKLPLDARRLHRGSVAIGAIAFVAMIMVGAWYIDRQFGDKAARLGDAIIGVAAALLAWGLHRLLFAKMKQWTGVIDDRTFDERYEPARHYVAAVAFLMLSGTGLLIGMGEPEDAPSVLHIAPLLGVLLFYKTTVTITARRIRKKLAAAEPPAAREGGAT